MRARQIFFWALLLAGSAALLQDAKAATLEKDFSNPPVEVRPYVWWHWMGPNISKEGITRDLEAMKEAGIGGATIFHITSAVTVGAKPTANCPWPDITYRSAKWWALMKHAAAEANRLGLELGMHNCVGYATTGGPWITPERGMQQLVRKMQAVQGGKQVMIDLPLPGSNPVDLGVFAVPAEGVIPLDKIIDLSAKMDAKGHLVWEAPPGAWNVYRIGYAFSGRQPSPMPDDVLNKAFEVDKMSAEQNRYHWQQVIEPLKQNLGALVGKSFRHILIDSYEAGDQNWTARFREEFKRLKGYDPLPWLMTMNTLVTEGRREEIHSVADADRSARFEWDYLDVIKTLFAEGFRAGAQAMHEAGLTFQWEPYSGPFDRIAGAALADTPMGEFWTGGQGGIDTAIAAAGRAAGRRVIGAESFTGVPPISRWTETPAFLKASGDGTYACGVNRLVLHHWVHQPFDEKYKPGIGMGWWGTHFGRHQTWFEPGKAYFAYLGRAQALLQRGEGVADYLALDHAPAGADAVATVALLNGDLRVKAGAIMLPSGRRYPFLQLPPRDAMLPEVARALKKLVAAGGIIAGQKPVRSPSLSGYPAADAEVRKIGEELWSNTNVLAKAVNPAPAVTTPGADIRTTARKDGETDIFFLANTGNEAREFTASFRVTGKQPELWQAEDGTSRSAAVLKNAAGRTELPVRLNAHQSVFVVFRKPAPADHAVEIVTVDTAAAASCVAWIDDAGKVVVRSPGPCRGEIAYASGKRAPFAVEASAPIPLAGAWTVEFASGLGAPAQVSFPELRSWSENADTNIKYFSGTATYRKEIRLDAMRPSQRTLLDLGAVHELASVKVNGRSLGVFWYPPFVMDITAALKTGVNRLEIRVTNTWANRLIGDEQEPEDSQWTEWEGFRDFGGYCMKAYPDWFVKNQPRPSPGRKCFVTYNYFKKDTALFPAGLLGPVRLIIEDEVKP
ncbi:MAG: glycosyl hydrolase [bacterium]